MSGFTGYVKGSVLADLYNLHFLKDSVIVEGMISGNLFKHKENIKAGLDLSEIKITTPGDSATIHKITASLNSDSLAD